jgi:serine acetyltransferase
MRGYEIRYIKEKYEDSIGHDSIIAPNAVVTKSIPPYSVVAGVPGRIINTITIENFEKYKSYGIAPLPP